MTRTARRRWTRELQSEIDGIAIGDKGPLLVHVYDQPAGGRWVDSAIPGKLGAFDRNSGEQQWLSPCEVGYGRGFGAGFGAENEAIVLGPSTNGHRIVRMSLQNGELIDVGQVPAFDEADVFEDRCLCVSARRVTAVDSRSLRVAWSYDREGERYHKVARVGNRVFVVFTQHATKKQGVLVLDTASGDFEGQLLSPTQTVIHDMAVDRGAVVLLADDLGALLSREVLLQHLLSQTEDAVPTGRGLALVALEPGSESKRPLWFEALGADEDGDVAEASISSDSGKLYLVRGAFLEVRDALTGRSLGDYTVPGLDERVAWRVCQGAGVLAEETRASIFELPA